MNPGRMLFRTSPTNLIVEGIYRRIRLCVCACVGILNIDVGGVCHTRVRKENRPLLKILRNRPPRHIASHRTEREGTISQGTYIILLRKTELHGEIVRSYLLHQSRFTDIDVLRVEILLLLSVINKWNIRRCAHGGISRVYLSH